MKMDSLFGLDKPGAVGEDVALLTTVYDPVEMSILRSILETEEIPYRIRERGSGGVVKVVFGYSMYGSDVFVPSSCLAAAQELLAAFQNAVPIEESGEETEE